jgi:hypothetical protein
MKRRRRMRRNGLTTDDMLHMGIAAAAGIGIGFVLFKPKTTISVAGLRGLGAYFHDPVNIPFSGLGTNYVATR